VRPSGSWGRRGPAKPAKEVPPDLWRGAPQRVLPIRGNALPLDLHGGQSVRRGNRNGYRAFAMSGATLAGVYHPRAEALRALSFRKPTTADAVRVQKHAWNCPDCLQRLIGHAIFFSPSGRAP
jgi:hypothetical protein